jgi:multiple sugar transport system ATP-binding protein
VGENIGFGLKLRRMDNAEIAKRVQDVARLLGLQDLLDRRPKQLSGGQRQRVAMGRAIVRQPRAFLMDEPLSNLDAKLRVQMRAEVSHLQRELKVTTVYVTHDQVEAMTMGDRVAVMRKGVLLQVDAPQALYDNPVNLFVAGFIGSPPMNLTEGIVEIDNGNTFLRFGSQRLRLAEELVAERPSLRQYAGTAVAVGIRPQDMEDAANVPDSPVDQRLTSQAFLTEALGSEVVVHFTVESPPVSSEDAKELAAEHGGGEMADVVKTTGTKVVASFAPRSRVRPGDTIEVAVDTRRLYLFDLGTGLAIH